MKHLLVVIIALIVPATAMAKGDARQAFDAAKPIDHHDGVFRLHVERLQQLGHGFLSERLVAVHHYADDPWLAPADQPLHALKPFQPKRK